MFDVSTFDLEFFTPSRVFVEKNNLSACLYQNDA